MLWEKAIKSNLNYTIRCENMNGRIQFWFFFVFVQLIELVFEVFDKCTLSRDCSPLRIDCQMERYSFLVNILHTL